MIKKKILFAVASGCMLMFSACDTKNTTSETNSKTEKYYIHDDRVEELLSKMTIEEKVGQMTQVNLNKILVTQNGSGYDNSDGTIDQALLDTAVVRYKVGSILNAINHAYSLEQWHEIIKQIQDRAIGHDGEGVKIPVLYGIDAIHGTTFTLGSTLFPHNIGIGASRNPEVARMGAKITANEVRASGIRWNFDPVFDIGRQPLWPRFPETYGEDPHIITQMGVASVKGYEEDGLENVTAVASCMKHFVGYSASRTGRDRTPSYIPEIELREYYLPQFKAAIEAGASTIMINSGEVNGIPVHGNKYLLTTVLREEMGFKGLVVTDWEDINRLHERHMVAPSLKEAVRMGILAGIDMSMTPHDYKFAKLLVEIVKEGDKEVAARVDESVRRILKLKFDVGLMDNPYTEEDAIALFGKDEYAEEALDAALQTMTLLQNKNNVLPLKSNAKILLAGPAANNISSLHGCWSYTWQGADQTMSWTSFDGTEKTLDLYPSTTLTVKQAFEQKLGASNVICKSVSNYEDPKNYELGSVAGVDAVVLCLGENAYAESPGSIQDLTLDARQIALAKAAVKSGKPVVVVLIQGRPRVISSFADDVDGILLAYWPSSKGADAIAQTVLGEYNPGGKLPFTYPRTTGDIVMYDHKWTEQNVEASPGVFTDTGYNPQFPFGHGLSYTTFEFSDMKLSSDQLTADGEIKVSVTVTNTGDRDGDEVVELYTRQMYGSITPSLRRLRKFERISLKAGESKVVELSLTKKDLQIAAVDYEGHVATYSYKTEPGEYKAMINGFGFDLEEPEFPWTIFLSRPYKNALTFTYKN